MDFIVLPMSHSDLNKLNVCWNNVYRKVFGMHMWESVKCVQLYCERLDLISVILIFLKCFIS